MCHMYKLTEKGSANLLNWYPRVSHIYKLITEGTENLWDDSQPRVWQTWELIAKGAAHDIYELIAKGTAYLRAHSQ